MLSDKDLEILDNLEILKENANTYLREIKNGRICPRKKKKKHVGNIKSGSRFPRKKKQPCASE